MTLPEFINAKVDFLLVLIDRALHIGTSTNTSF